MTHWQSLLDPNIQAFIKSHENADIRDLALRKPPNLNWPYVTILDQIKARQKAKTKIPQWLEHENIIFPSNDTLEQASSTATALYKASLFQGNTFADLTGGAGIDSWALSQNFENGFIIDADEDTAARLAHNFKILTDNPLKVFHTTAETCLQSMPQIDLILIDPQRRNQNRKGLYKLEDCTPNIFDLLPILKEKTTTILLKTSPMMDINQGIEQLGCVSAIHVLEWQGECKEVLYVLTPNQEPQNIPITAAKLDSNGKTLQSFTFTREGENTASPGFSEPLKYLYEPGPAFMKAGCYKSIATRYDLTKLHPHTHLYTSETPCTNFPGRSFEILGLYPVQSKTLPIPKANLAIRNFPQSIQTLKKKLKLKDGGDDMLFACTLQNEKHTLIHCRKIDK